MVSDQSIVYIVEDDPTTRESLEFLLASAAFEVEAHRDAETFLARFDRNVPSCLILDLELPGMSGLELQVELASIPGAPPVVVLTGNADVPLAVRAMELGAYTFFEKPYDPDLLLKKTAGALESDRSSRARAEQRAEVADRIDSLTPAELGVFERLVQGQRPKQIAIESNVSQQAVSQHRSRILEKLGADNVPKLILQLHAVGLSTDPCDDQHTS